MLAITPLIPLLLAAAAVSASPFTFSRGLAVVATPAAPTTSVTPTTIASVTGTPSDPAPPSSPAQEAPRRTQEPQAKELRDVQPAPVPVPRDAVADGGGFAISSAAAAAADPTTPTSTTLAAAAAAATLVAAQAQEAEAPAPTEAPPVDNPSVDGDLAREGYSQTTYYACERYAATTMCGWHEPVVYVGGGAPAPGRGVGGVAVGAAACGMVANWALGW